jgi:hypothetical protein
MQGWATHLALARNLLLNDWASPVVGDFNRGSMVDEVLEMLD